MRQWNLGEGVHTRLVSMSSNEIVHTCEEDVWKMSMTKTQLRTKKSVCVVGLYVHARDTVALA